MTHRQRRSERRRGSITLEFIIAFPVLLIVSAAVFQFGVMLIVQQAVTQAATVGARDAGNNAGITVNDLAGRVNAVLAVHNLEARDGDLTSDVLVVLEVGRNNPAIPAVRSEFGDPELVCTPNGPVEIQPDEVRVTVCVDLTTSPLLNVLRSFGIDFAGRRFQISSIAQQQG